jgi:DnaK suppressor protein
MDIKTTNHFRQLLLKLQSATEELEMISKDSGKPVQLDQSMVGRLSRMDAIQLAEMAQEASRRRKQQLVRIPIALVRIESGDYGFCLICDEQIPTGRLEIDPTYTHCIKCAEKME